MSQNIYAQRRARLASQLASGGIAIIPTAPEQRRNRDSDFLFRFDSYFHYLTGFTEPNATLVLLANGHSIMFCQPKDEAREIWDGIRLGPAAAPAQLGLQTAFSSAELDAHLPVLLENTSVVYFPFATHSGLDGQINHWLEAVRSKARQGITCPAEQRDLCALLDEMRLIKDSFEIAIMRRAAQISAGAHIRAMKLSAQRLRQGLKTGEVLREFHLDAELLHEFRMHGSEYPAYSSIVAGGANACVLHYRADAAPILDGGLVLIDAGCELHGYASDITRTFPANGKFSPAQRELYDIVLASQEAAAAATKPGNRFNDPHDAALAILAQGMLDVGLLDANVVGSLQDVIEKRAYTPFYMHRTSHWLGMDVHDCGSYIEPSEAHIVTEKIDPVTKQTVQVRPSRILREGMVLTLEPGIYVRPAAGVPERYHNIGIRIEDDALVTANGCELLSRGVPVDADEIEALMK
jgi:Xaa-Pro aminopeptidase